MGQCSSRKSVKNRLGGITGHYHIGDTHISYFDLSRKSSEWIYVCVCVCVKGNWPADV